MSLKSLNKIETNKYELTVTVNADEFEAAIAKAYRKNVGKINVQGFRKGKAPRHIIEKRYGESVFYEDAINDYYPEAYAAAVQEANITPVDHPSVEIVSVGKEGFEFKAVVVNKQECEIDGYTGIAVDKTVKQVTDADINEEIEKLRNRGARVVDASDRPAADGDMVLMDFEGFIDGVPFKGGKAEKYHLTLGSNQFIPGFEAQIVGHSVGEEFDVNVTFPEDYHVDDLKGKPSVFKVKLHEIKTRQYPVVDDEFAKDVSEFDTLDDLKEDISRKLREKFDAESQNAVENKLVQTITDNLKGEIPEVMFENKINELAADFERRLNAQKLSMKDYLKYTGSDEKTFKEAFREQAVNQVKMRLALETIVKKENITVDQSEIDAEYQKIADSYKINIDEVKKFIPIEDISADAAANKAIDLIKNSAVITEKSAEDAVKPKTAKKKAAPKAKSADESAEAPAKAAKTTKAAAKTAEAPAKTAKTTKAAAKTAEAPAKAAKAPAKAPAKTAAKAAEAPKSETKTKKSTAKPKKAE